jgi:hypothetical protein
MNLHKMKRTPKITTWTLWSQGANRTHSTLMAFLRHLPEDGLWAKRMWYSRSARRGTAMTKRAPGAHRAQAGRKGTTIWRVDEKKGKG